MSITMAFSTAFMVFAEYFFGESANAWYWPKLIMAVAAAADFRTERRVNTAADIDRAKADRKIAVITGLQNSEHFRTAADVKTFHQLGQRCSQLTYNAQNLLGTGGTERVDSGLSDYGVEIVKSMNAVGMLVDVSHCGDRTTIR